MSSGPIGPDHFRAVTGASWSRSRRRARDREVDAGDEGGEFLHVLPQKVFGGLGGDRAVWRDEPRLELDVGLGRIHLRRVAEAQEAAQVLLCDRGTDGTR